MPIQAQMLVVQGSDCERGQVRHHLRLPVEGSFGATTGALVLNLSKTGLLIETSDDLAVGDVIQIDLPGAGARSAKVVWHSDKLFGCEFEEPIVTAAVSAALLRSPPVGSHNSSAPGPEGPSPLEQGSGDVDSAGVKKLPLRTRAWIIIGLTVASWAAVGVPVALLVL